MSESCPGLVMLQISNDDLMMLAVLLDEEEEECLAQVKRRWCVHPACRNRQQNGEFNTLYPSLLSDRDKFLEYFRMSEHSFNVLLQKLEVHLAKKDTFWRKSITPRERLAVLLRYLATGNSFNNLSFSFRMGKSTVRKIVHETCDIIKTFLMPETMQMPTEDRWKRIAAQFEDLWQFPHCIGALDCKHVAIRAPANSGSLYLNVKKHYSIILLALVDANCNFIAVDVGAYGKSSDGRVFANSNLGKRLLQKSLNVPAPSPITGTDVEVPYVIVGDEAFPLHCCVMRPFPGQDLDSEKRHFNYRLNRARRTVENAFDMLSQKFNIFYRRINSSPHYVDNIVLAACTLFNFVRKSENIRNGHCDTANATRTILPLQPFDVQGLNETSYAFCIRNKFKTYFSSPAGRLPWLTRNDHLQQ